VKSINYTPAGYWDRRYREGRTSGAGSEGEEGAYKAQYVSEFIRHREVTSVIDWGCGDGQVLELVDLHGALYHGVDCSPTILDRMRRKFPQHSFSTDEVHQPTADLALSMDVLFHLPADHDYNAYLHDLFKSARRFVIIYATNYAGGRTARHVFRREFTPDIAKRFPDWELTTVETPLREGLASFFVYEKKA
jgi:cyclopropane fatty-acyl-phospholipid synthase-like methyltransferase